MGDPRCDRCGHLAHGTAVCDERSWCGCRGGAGSVQIATKCEHCGEVDCDGDQCRYSAGGEPEYVPSVAQWARAEAFGSVARWFGSVVTAAAAAGNGVGVEHVVMERLALRWARIIETGEVEEGS